MRRSSDHFQLYTNTMHFFTTHLLKLRMEVKGRERGEVVIISSYTLTHKQNAFFATHLLKLRMDWEGNEKR